MNAHVPVPVSAAAAIDSLMAAMCEQGIETQDTLRLDGTLERFHVEGDRRGSKNGWVCAHLDAKPAGQFGCNKRFGSHKFSWKAERSLTKALTPAELKAMRDRAEKQRQEKAEQTRQRQQLAAERAKATWDAAVPAPADHPYLARKAIGAHGVRLGVWEVVNPDTGEVRIISDKALLVPFMDRQRNVRNLQAILPGKLMSGGTRDKDFLKDGEKLGLSFPIGTPRKHEGRNVFIIAEGFATGASIHEATGHCVLVTFDTSNLLAVADSIRERQADAIIVIGADNDQWTLEPVANPGLHYARKAAAAVGGFMAYPSFPASAEGRPTDFNDLHVRQGIEAVAAVINHAVEKGKVPAEPELPAHMTEELPAELAEQAVQDLDAALSFADVEELPEGTPWIAPSLGVQADRTPAAAGSTSVLSSATLAGCEELGILPLGTISDMYAFWRRDTGTLELIRAKDVGSESSFLRLATKQGWEFWCTENGGKYDRSAIANALIQSSKLLGQMELSRIPSSLATPEHVEAEYARAMLAVKPSAGMLSQMIAAHPDWKGADLWFDEFANDIKSTGEPPCGGGAGSWTDHHDVLMCGWVAAQWGANVSKSCAAEAVLLLAAQNKRHPVREYLNGLTWDGTPRLDTWLVDLVGCPADIYTQAVGPKTLIGAVARVMRPGCKHDTVLILEGEQGKRKSTLVASLLPNDAWFAEDLGADIGSKDAMDGLAGKWIVELAELANMEKSESKAIKSFIARKTDRYRPSYGKRSMDFKRQTILIGTVNPEGDGRYLKDPTGGRRFWPIKCGDINIERAVEIRDQLWAEAAARFKNGEAWWLNDEQEAAASKVQGERQEDNHWLDRVERYLTHFAPTGPGTSWGGKRASKLQVVVVSDIFEAVIGRPYMKRDVSESRNIADALRSLGWQYKPSGYIDGRKCRHWAAPGYRGQDDYPF